MASNPARSFLAWDIATSVLNGGWAIYLLATPDEVFATSPQWAGVLALVPGRSSSVLGAAFLALALAMTAGLSKQLLTIGWLAHGVGLVSWTIFGGTFGWFALQNAGLGIGFALLALYAAVAHTILLYARRDD